jgi:NAD(P)-dependent dehydrogenase (short-subunit alcohol dehydrogenase family)
MTRTYVVTGAASGIGAALARQLQALGHRVIATDRQDADVVADLSTPAGRQALIDGVTHATDGVVDAVIACAGTIGRGATDVQVNYFGAIATIEGLRPLLARGTSARAVAVASFALLDDVDDELVAACLDGDEAAAIGLAKATPPDASQRIYASAKRALARRVRQIAPTPEWAGAGIAINSIAPGVIRTPMTEPFLANAGLADLLLATVPMPLEGVLEPDDVAQLAVTLTDPAIRGVTGQTIFIDGGGDCVRRGDDIWVSN